MMMMMKKMNHAWLNSKKIKKNKEIGKNPYSGTGLDKFSKVVSELETRKKKIMEGAESQTIYLVRFIHSDCRNGWIPIIMREPNTGQDDPYKNNKFLLKSNASKEQLQKEPSRSSDHTPRISKRPEQDKEKSFSFDLDKHKTNTSCYWCSVLMLTLLFLLIDGRMLAICCTSACWYLIPAIRRKKTTSSLDDPRSSKDYS